MPRSAEAEPADCGGTRLSARAAEFGRTMPRLAIITNSEAHTATSPRSQTAVTRTRDTPAVIITARPVRISAPAVKRGARTRPLSWVAPTIATELSPNSRL